MVLYLGSGSSLKTRTTGQSWHKVGPERILVVRERHPISQHYASLDKGVEESSRLRRFFILPSQAWHLPKMLAGASQLSGLSIFHNGVVCFPKQDSIVWKPWHRAYRVQIKVDLHTQAVTKAPRMNEAAWGSRRRTLASLLGRCISESPPSIPAYWSTARRLIPTRYLSLLGFYPSENICTEFSRDMHEDVL